MVSDERPAPIRRVSSNTCSGCLLYALGFLLIFAFPVGTIIGVLLIIMGHSISSRNICGNCGNSIEETSRICPVCKSRLYDESKYTPDR